MKMPNPDQAIVDIRKLRDYCLSPEHPRGRHKARVFAATLGLTANDADELRRALLAAAYSDTAVLAEGDHYGQRYLLDFAMITGRGRAEVRSCWIVRRGENFPRLTSCYVR
jgi:hypothetical protein